MSLPDFTTRGVAETRKQVVATLAAGPGIILVEGSTGSGKSHLKQQLIRGLTGDFTVVDLAYSRLDPDEFCTALGAQPVAAAADSAAEPQPAPPLDRLRQRTRHLAEQNRPLLVCIDDAQFLPTATRELLLALITGSNAPASPLYAVLFADSSADFSLVGGADPEQGLRSRMVLNPPSETDLSRLIDLILVLGGTNSSALSKEERNEILASADGSLRQTRHLTEQALLQRASDDADNAGTQQSPPSSAGQFAFGLLRNDDDFGPATVPVGRQNELARLGGSPGSLPATSYETQLEYREAPASDSPPPVSLSALQRRHPLLLAAGLLACLGIVGLIVVDNGQGPAPGYLEEPRPGDGTRAARSDTAMTGAPAPTADQVAAPGSTTDLAALSAPEETSSSGLVRRAVSPDAVSVAQATRQPEDTNEGRSAPLVDKRTRSAVAATLPPSPPPSEPLKQLLTRWLAEAQAHEAAYRLTLPAQANAVQSYRKILAADANHPEARLGLERIRELYRKRAEQALAQEQWDKARHNFNRILWIDDEDKQALAELARLPAQSE
ncbi:ATP-binding protein [Motiliproteus sp. SC1-56]|uniref:ATP-binding protein n=1 Tax=Motiliproteus sp. SC1-56 TaxID=2799565 RepID=UPI001A90344B|nr:ATP-binding protein [Motiliproteus sp. SC1-56]